MALPLVVGVSAQTASELANKYAHHEVYEIQPGVQMTAKFAANGLVCQMQIEQERFLQDEVDLTNGIEKDSVHGLMDQLVPPSERGKKDAGRNGMVIGLGQSMESIERYANVDIHVLSTTSEYPTTTVAIVNWQHRKCSP
ncbi:MAG: hypothetical protein WB566_11960 [Terriglobales bacterium]